MHHNIHIAEAAFEKAYDRVKFLDEEEMKIKRRLDELRFNADFELHNL